VTALSGGLSPFDETVSASTEVVADSVFAVATADSGALVFGQVKSSFSATFAPPEGQVGGTVEVGQKYYLGLGATTLTATKSISIQFLQTVVLAVPPKGADFPIRVVAVADIPTAAAVE
jgi:hypothetical protein